jgi:hypothetical protein
VVTETFQIALEPGKSFNFRWNPPKSQSLHIKVMVFQLLSDGTMVIMRENEEEEFIELSIREEGHTGYTSLGKIYIEKTTIFNFDTDFKYFRLTNNIEMTVLVVVDLEKLQEVVSAAGAAGAVHNDQLDTPKNKLAAIRSEVLSG